MIQVPKAERAAPDAFSPADNVPLMLSPNEEGGGGISLPLVKRLSGRPASSLYRQRIGHTTA